MEDIKKEKMIEEYPRPITIEGTKIILNQLENCICKIFNPNGEKGTGFFCIINYKNNIIPVMMTNNHVINEDYIKMNNYISIGINDNKEIKKIKLNDNRIIYTKPKEEYDITIIEIKPEKDKINNFMEIDDDIFQEGSETIYNSHSVYVLQYPKSDKGDIAAVSYGIVTNINQYNICHKCSTESGSSGSPIMNLLNHKIIGIHKEASLKFKINKGTYLKYPINDFIKKYRANIEKFEYNIESKMKGNYLIYKPKKNEIEMELKIDEEDLKRNIYYLGEKALMSLNEIDIDLYINNKLSKYKKYFEPKKVGIYTIKLIFKKSVYNCSYMFEKCENIININFENFNFKNITDVVSMFSGCKNLTNLDLSSLDTNNVTDMSYMFSECEKLTNLDLSSFNTKNVTNMTYMFSKCGKLINFDLSSFDTKNVTDMSNMFSYCEKLKNLDISSFNTKNVTNMSSMFSECNGLTSLNVSSFDTKNVTDMSYMFSHCGKLKNLDLTNFITKKVEDMHYMFSYCFDLKEINLSSFNTSLVKDMSYMFYKCYDLTKIDLTCLDTKNVKSIKGIFYGCKLDKINLPHSFSKFGNVINERDLCKIF